MENLIGQRLANRYDIQALVGYGGMGVVYRGYDALLRRTVAIKVLPLRRSSLSTRSSGIPFSSTQPYSLRVVYR